MRASTPVVCSCNVMGKGAARLSAMITHFETSNILIKISSVSVGGTRTYSLLYLIISFYIFVSSKFCELFTRRLKTDAVC